MNEDELKAELENKESPATKYITNLVSAAVSTAVEGVQQTNTDLKNEKTKLQGILDNMPDKEQLEAFANMQKQLDNSDDAKLIAEGKLDEVVTRRTERLRTDYETKLSTSKSENENLKKSNSNLSNSYDLYRIDNAIRAEATKQGVVPHAVDDLVSRALGVFTMEDSKLVSRNSDGELLNKTPSEYITDLKEIAPHFWPASESANLKGGKNIDDKLIAAGGDTNKFIEMRRKQIADKNK